MVSSGAVFARSLVLALFTLSSLTASVSGHPFASASSLSERDQKSLKIWPLGASITWGTHSQSGNGYRKPLRDELVSAKWDVEMVGTKHHGNMTNNNVDGYPGYTIARIEEAALKALPTLHDKPNLVLIHAGTNDCHLNLDIKNAGDRMQKLIESILKVKDMEKATIILSTLLYSNQKEVKANRDAVNAQYRNLVTAMKKKGTSIWLAEMNDALSWPADYTVNGKADDTHPSDAGYAKMAKVWFKAIQAAHTPSPPPKPEDQNKPKPTTTVPPAHTETETITIESAKIIEPGVEVDVEVVTETIVVS